MPKNLTSIKFDIDNSNSNSYVESSPSIFYSLYIEKQNNEKKIIELERQLNLSIKLLSKVTDAKQRSKLELKKKNCLEERESLKAAINEIGEIYLFLYKSQQIYPFVEDFYTFFIKLFNTDSDIDSFFIKKLEALQNKEKQLIESMDCVLDLKAVLPDLNDHDKVEKFIDNFFSKIEVTCKNTPPNGFFNYIVLCEKIFEIFYGLLQSLENGVFNLKSLRDFFQVQAVNFSLPSTNHSLVGIIAFLIYKTLFNFLKCQPIGANVEKLNVYIKFHIDISSAPMDKFILHELSSMRKKMHALKNKLKESPKTKAGVSKGTVDESLKSIEIGRQELNSIKLFLNNIFKNKIYLHSLNLLNSILKKPEDELIIFMKERTGLDSSLVIDKKNICTFGSNKMFISYFFSSIYTFLIREELRKNVEYFTVLVAKQTEESPLIDLIELTNKDLLTLSYLAYSVYVIFEFQIQLDRLREKLKHSKLSLLGISLDLSLNTLNTDIKNLEEKEKIFFKNKFIRKNKFSECKKKLLEEFEFFLDSIRYLISQAEEINNLSGSSQVSHFQKFSDFYLNKTLYLMGIINKFSVKRDEVEKYLLPENGKRTTEVKKSSLEKHKVDVKEKLINFESLFQPMTYIAKSLSIVADYIGQLERVIIECNENRRKKNRFFSALGKICSSANLISPVFHEFDRNGIVSPNLINSLEAIKQAIEKTIPTLDNEKNLNLFLKEIESCFLFIERIYQEIIAVTRKCESYANEIEELIKNEGLEAAISSNFFRCNSELKKINTIFEKKYDNLIQKIACLKNVINVIGGKEASIIRKFYRVIAKADEYKEIFNCIRRKNEVLPVYARSFPIMIDKNKQSLEVENHKLSSKNKEKSFYGKKLTLRSANPSLESDACRLLELRKFSQWSAEFEDWKQKRYSYLDNVFNTIEKCSWVNLNKTATVFFKILDYYNKALCFKQRELKEQLSQVGTFLQSAHTCLEPIKNFMVYSDQWFANVLARLEVCKHYLLQSSETYHVSAGNNFSSNACARLYSPACQEINKLQTDYLKYTLIYNKTNKQLLLEEKKLAAINEAFIVKMLQKNSLSGIEQETDLLFQFNEKLSEVNRLHSSIKEVQKERQRTKEELARWVEPESLNFYLRRIDPSDTPILTNSLPPAPIAESYVLIPSSFYFLADDAANISLAARADCESNLAY